MALVSAGVEVTIIDESQYTSGAINTVPYILLATAQDKLDPSGTAIAPGTTESTVGDVYLITSQRELVNTFGDPVFNKTAGGDAIHGHELNEYGLMAAYSVLGATNRAYIQRVDIDLAELEASLVRPTGNAANGTRWLDLTETEWGFFEWSSVKNTFDVQTPILITEQDQLAGSAPLTSIGTVGSYAVATDRDLTGIPGPHPIWYKNSSNEWVLIGSDLWKASVPTVIGTESNPTITLGDDLIIDGTTVTATGTTIDSLANDINVEAITGVTAAVVNGRLEIYKETGNASATTSSDVTLTIAEGTADDLLTTIGIPADTYAGPIVDYETHVNIPRWRTTDTTPRPSGSFWVKTSSVNFGANIVFKVYDSVGDEWVEQDVPLYEDDQTANKWLDPASGGSAIPAGEIYGQYDIRADLTGSFQFLIRDAGETSVTGSVAAPVFTPADEFTIETSLNNDDILDGPYTVTMSGTTAADFVSDVLAANIPYVTAEVDTTGAVTLIHTNGGVIKIEETTGTPVTDAGITIALTGVRVGPDTSILISNWRPFLFTASLEEPGQDPVNGTRWYYSDIGEVDIMIHDGGTWKGYQNVTNDVRGFDLSLTDPAGPIVSANAPTEQSDGTALEFGDIWVDTSDIENYPVIRRWETDPNTLSDKWILIDTADQTSTDGILFADARWDTDGTVDPVADDLVAITDLLTSDYKDLDAPDEDLYPDGMLLWNMRRSGYNVKEFRVDHFNLDDFTGPLPTVTNSWVTVSGNRDDGSAFMGRHAQRSLVVEALKAAIDTNTDIREEQRQFNIISVPGYPELIPNMVALNNERANTSFIVGDTPLRLENSGTEITKWASNNDGAGLPGADGLQANDEYLGVFYPSGRTNDLTGTSIVVPPSHMILRTIIHSDEQSYPWLAPAGIRRGVVDNASAIGYVDGQTGEFVQMSTRQGIRDVLYTNNVNPITFVPGAGIVNYGNKTTVSSSALDRINVSRLVSYIRVQLDALGKLFVFEPNDKLTRDEIKGQVERLLNDLIAKRGIYDYLVVCDESNNTPLRIDRNELWVDVAIEPVKAAEFIYIPVRIKNTGEISGS